MATFYSINNNNYIMDIRKLLVNIEKKILEKKWSIG